MGSPVTRVQTSLANPVLEAGVQRLIRSLVVSADLEIRKPLVRILGSLGADVVVCSRLSEAEEILSRTSFDAVFCDEHLPDGPYSDLIHDEHSITRILRVIVTTRHGDWDSYLQALAKGAFDFIRYPFHATNVELILIRASRGGDALPGANA